MNCNSCWKGPKNCGDVACNHNQERLGVHSGLIPRKLDIENLVYVAHGMAKAKGWWDNPRTPGECIALMHSELSEALEEIRAPKCYINEIWHQEDGKPEGVPAELADVIIRIADFCGFHNIDLQAAICEKMAYNKNRQHRHGGNHG